MKQNQELPYIHTYINGNYLGVPNNWIPAYWVYVTALPNRPLLFTSHTEHGALYSRLPIDAFSPVNNIQVPPKVIESSGQRWSNLGRYIEVIQPTYLKDYTVEHIHTKETGRYLFSIDYVGELFSEDPEQHKTLHLIEMDNRYVLLPNNEILFTDKHFVDKSETIRYSRNLVYFTTKE